MFSLLSLPLMYSTKSVTFVLEPNNRLYPGGPGGPGGPWGPSPTLWLMYCSISFRTPWAGEEFRQDEKHCQKEHLTFVI